MIHALQNEVVRLVLLTQEIISQVKWDSEIECFESFLRELAYFYVPEPVFDLEDSAESTQHLDSEKTAEAAMRWQIQHLLFPTIAKYMVAPRTLLDRDVVQVANLPDLYRVFERC